ncbi:MAG: hypothetical protein QM813_07560 [Verrucomicrobiota bacterium]
MESPSFARWWRLGGLGLMLVFFAAQTEAVERLKKTVQLYALTSANDFPQRDPQDWRLLGSNDAGKTWTALDVRKGEVFQDRQQRRLFKTGNTTGYETYRLQIDRVRDPKVANSVQLAEIELMGTTENDLEPIPIFTDAITAQGDNPPSELAGKLFDGRVETKWLDNKPRDRSTCASWVQWQYAAPAETVVTNISQLAALRARANDGYRVQIEGVVVGRTGADHEWSIADAAGCVEISALAGEEGLQPGQFVTFSGVSQWRSGKVRLTNGAIRVRGADSATIPEPIHLEQPLAERENLKWVEIEGVVRYRRSDGGELSFDVQDEGAAIRVYWRGTTDSLSLPPAGTRVTVRGLCRGAFNERGAWVVAGLWAAGAEAVTPAGSLVQNGRTPNGATSAKSAALVPDTLTKIEQIRRLTQEQLQRRPHVKFRGVVTELFGAFMQDDTAGVEVAFQGNESRKVTEPGTYIEVEGWGGLGDAGNPVVSADRVMVLGKGKWPEPQRMSLSQLMSGRTDAQWIELEGVGTFDGWGASAVDLLRTGCDGEHERGCCGFGEESGRCGGAGAGSGCHRTG